MFHAKAINTRYFQAHAYTAIDPFTSNFTATIVAMPLEKKVEYSAEKNWNVANHFIITGHQHADLSSCLVHNTNLKFPRYMESKYPCNHDIHEYNDSIQTVLSHHLLQKPPPFYFILSECLSRDKLTGHTC